MSLLPAASPAAVNALSGARVLLTGASRGIGRAIAERLARRGAKLALLARSADAPAHARLEGSLHDTVVACTRQGAADALLLPVDLTDAAATRHAVRRACDHMGGIDVVINNASALSLERWPSLKTYDLLMGLNVRATYGVIAAALDDLRASPAHGRVVSIAPPLRALSVDALAPHPVYATSKFGMTMVTLGFGGGTIRANTLWPSRMISTAATRLLEERTGIPAHSQGHGPEHFVDALEMVLSSNESGRSWLDSDLVDVPPDGVPDVFV